jgi:hypothetical protein
MNTKVAGKVLDVQERDDLRYVILDDGKSFPTSYYPSHSLENLRPYIGRQVILDISPRKFLFDIKLDTAHLTNQSLDTAEKEALKAQIKTLEEALSKAYERESQLMDTIKLLEPPKPLPKKVGFFGRLFEKS